MDLIRDVEREVIVVSRYSDQESEQQHEQSDGVEPCRVSSRHHPPELLRGEFELVDLEPRAHQVPLSPGRVDVVGVLHEPRRVGCYERRVRRTRQEMTLELPKLVQLGLTRCP